MMLRTLLPSHSQRYAFAGSAIGALLPLSALLGEFLKYGSGYNFRVQMAEPVYALMMIVPVLTGMIFHYFGASRDSFEKRISGNEEQARKLLALSLADRLTGLPNRRALEIETQRNIAARDQGLFRPAYLLLDLDKFKNVNDTLGHEAGDRLLAQFAERLQRSVGPFVQIYRLGGDEFVVVVAGCPGISDVERLCRLVEQKADEPFLLDEGQAIIGVSIGVAFLEREDNNLAEVLKKADIALYIAKDVPSSAHAVHNEELGRRMQERMQMEQDLANALREDEFFLEYQPILGAHDRAIQGLEALVRWRHPTKGILGPDAFIPIAERSGQIMAIGRLVLSKSISDAARWPDNIGISVNICGDEFRDPGLVEHIGALLSEYKVRPSRLTIEVTESIFTIDTGAIRHALVELKSMGIRIALDDFGMGFSSINHLRQFPVDHLKVDRSFTSAMADGGRDRDLVDIIIKIGRAFDIDATIEGVEDEHQLDLAVTMGASSLQGFHISRPVSAETVQAMLMATGSTPLRSSPLSAA